MVRTRWHDREAGSETPTDGWLDEAEATISAGVREPACRVNQDAASFAKAADNLARTAHLDLSKESLRQVVEGEGKAVLRAVQRAELGPLWSAADCTTEQGVTRVYAGCDGVKVPLITAQEKQNRRTGIREKRKLRGRKCRPLPRAKTGADGGHTWPREASLTVYTHQERAALTQGQENVDYRAYWEDMIKWSFGHPAIQPLDDRRLLVAYYAGVPSCLSIHWARIDVDGTSTSAGWK